MAYTISSEIRERTAWKRTHRPEEYLPDVITYIAGEIRVPRKALMPLAPVARGILRRWEDAAREFTEYTFLEDGARIMRTIFLIHNYSNSAVYAMIEKVLKVIGVGGGAAAAPSESDTDFAWVLLGGVLNDYAARAGVSRESTQALLNFRLRNSDYRTVTTWYPDCVEIANLETGGVESLPLPPQDIDHIVDWGMEYHTTKYKRHYTRVGESGACADEFNALMERYREITGAPG